MSSGLTYLLLSVASSTLIALIFKGFQKYEVNTFQAIVINYLVCILTGSLMMGAFPLAEPFWEEPWFPYALGLGLLFIVGFNIVAKTIQVFGVTIGSVSQKMSLILSVSFAILYFKEASDFVKILGIILALVAVVLTNLPSKKEKKDEGSNKAKYFYLIALTFLTSGIIEILLQYVEIRVASQSEDASFVVFLFACAFFFGSCYWLLNLFRGKMKPAAKNVVAGVVLGVPNFFSIYFLMLAVGEWGGSVIYPVNNVGIIGLSAVLAFMIFKEKISKLNWLGVVLAMLAIAMIGFSQSIISLLG